MLTLDEQGLVARARSGDEQAFEQLVWLHDRVVLRLALAMLRSEEDARDVYQETFLKAHRSLAGFRGGCSFRGWVLRIASNLCLDRLRRARAGEGTARFHGGNAADHGEVSLLERARDEGPGGDPARLAETREIGARIESALRALPARERLVFELKHYEGLKMAEIGAMIDATEETARNSLYRAHQKLRLALADLRGPGGAPMRVEP